MNMTMMISRRKKESNCFRQRDRERGRERLREREREDGVS